MKKQGFALSLCLLFVLFLLSPPPSFAAPQINEFSSADSSDWIEIYNSGAEVVDLSLYRIRDLTENNKLDLSGSLAPNSFAAFDWSNKLNNAGDLIKLVLISDEGIVDQTSYGDQGGIGAPAVGQSAGRKPDGGSEWLLFVSPSKNSSNNTSSTFSPPSPTPSKTPMPTKAPTPTKTPTQAKTSSLQESKTPTPKVSLTSSSTTSKTINPNSPSTKNTNFAKIVTYSKSASQFANIKGLEKEKKNKEVSVLGTKDKDFSFIPILIGVILLIGVIGWFIYKNLDQIKIWIQK